jgi:hypothetical protein
LIALILRLFRIRIICRIGPPNVIWKFLLNILDTITFDKNLHTQYKEYVNLLDSIRKTNFDQTFHPSESQDLLKLHN